MIDFVSILTSVAFLVCPFVAVLFVFRLVMAIFSAKVSEEIRRYPLFHTIWGCFALLGVFASLGVMSPEMWPPRSVERHRQRAEVLKRIQTAGGWAALRRDCDALAERHRDSGFVWHGDTNALPPTLAALRPWSVIFYSPDEPKVSVVRIKVFGSHSTGGRSTAYFGLEVVCATNAESYRPEPSHGGASGNRYDSYNRVTDTIYEIF